MRYAEKDNLETLWGADYLTDILPEDVDAASAIEEALDMASAEVDGYLVRYQLPLSSPPRVLVTPTANIAVYLLANRHAALTETIEKRYEQAIAFLDKLSKGTANLGADEPKLSSTESGSSGGAFFAADPRRTRDW